MNHEHLREELKNHVFYDDPSVFKRLGVYDDDASAIARCHADYMADPLMQKHAETLAEISEDAKKRIQKREKEMYGPLVCPFQLFTTQPESTNHNFHGLRAGRYLQVHSQLGR